VAVVAEVKVVEEREGVGLGVGAVGVGREGLVA
jgi:hypothetical protein